MIWLQSSLFLTIWFLCMIIMECHLQRKQTLWVTAEDLSNWSFSSVTNHFGAWEKFVFIYFIQDKLTQKEESSDPESKSSIGPTGKIYQGTRESSSSAGKAFNICHRAVLPPLIYRWSQWVVPWTAGHCKSCTIWLPHNKLIHYNKGMGRKYEVSLYLNFFTISNITIAAY